MKIYIEQTSNVNILKFIAPAIITKSSIEYNSIEEAKNSPLATTLFRFPFVKKVYISTNMIAVEKTDDATWEDVANDLKVLINEYYENDNIIKEVVESTSDTAYSLYTEITPNPNVLKFVVNKILYSGILDYKSNDGVDSNTVVGKIFTLPFVKEVFVTDNYISVTKQEGIDWQDVALETREFILNSLRSGMALFSNEEKHQQKNNAAELKSDYSSIELEIKNILEEYVKPAVSSDGGNIELVEYKQETKTAVMLLQGACSGCPSSTVTLKNGIETMLKDMLPNYIESVEALNG